MPFVINTADHPVDVGGSFLGPGEARELTPVQAAVAKQHGYGRDVDRPRKPPRGGKKGNDQ